MLNFKQCLIATFVIHLLTMFSFSSVIFAVAGFALIFVAINLKKLLDDQTTNIGYFIFAIVVIVFSFMINSYSKSLDRDFYTALIFSLFWCGMSMITMLELRAVYRQLEDNSTFLLLSMVGVVLITIGIVLANIAVAGLTFYALAWIGVTGHI